MKYLTDTARLKSLFVYVGILFAFSTAAMAQERVCVNADIANMRSAPTTKSDQLWQVEKYHPLIVLEKKGKWVKVKDFEGDTAWLHKSLLGNSECVITKKAKCNVRSSGSIKGKKLFTTERGVPFKVLDRKNGWIKVKHKDGDIGWISKKLVW